MKKQLVIGALAALLVSGVALAAESFRAQWSFYRSDMVRCADVFPNCGSRITGNDPLRDGRVTVTERNIQMRLSGAQSDTTYTLFFVALTNSGNNPRGPYAGSFDQIGEVTTSRLGSATATFENTSVPSASLGYFVVVNKEERSAEFATGFDPNPTPSPTETQE